MAPSLFDFSWLSINLYGLFLQVIEVFKPVKEVTAILQAVGADPSAYYTPQGRFRAGQPVRPRTGAHIRRPLVLV